MNQKPIFSDHKSIIFVYLEFSKMICKILKFRKKEFFYHCNKIQKYSLVCFQNLSENFPNSINERNPFQERNFFIINYIFLMLHTCTVCPFIKELTDTTPEYVKCM